MPRRLISRFAGFLQNYNSEAGSKSPHLVRLSAFVFVSGLFTVK